MSVKTDTENKKGALVLGQLPQTSAKEAAELEASCLKEAWNKNAWEDALKDKNAWYAGAWLDGRLVGCCGLWQSFEDADICNVAVDQTLRRQGIGEQLLLFLMENGKTSRIAASAQRRSLDHFGAFGNSTRYNPAASRSKVPANARFMI